MTIDYTPKIGRHGETRARPRLLTPLTTSRLFEPDHALDTSTPIAVHELQAT